MALFTAQQRRVARAVSAAVYCNQFLPQRITCEREALGADFVEVDAAWNTRAGLEGDHPNVAALAKRVAQLTETCKAKLAANPKASRADLLLYEDLVLYHLYHEHRDDMDRLIEGAADGASAKRRVAFYDVFERNAQRLMGLTGVDLPARTELPHVFACYFQIRRAFHHIFDHIVGSSEPTTRLRAAVWQSIFTHDLQRYRRHLHRHMADITTLITGPSGTGKELIARAVGLSRYIPFDCQTRTFTEDFAGSFYALNLSALSPTLIESELFGHKRGAFTGAVSDRAGWLEVCPPLGTVFLDEIGDLDPAIQVKLMRVLETRTFQRIGETKPRAFRGKLIAATNRDLAALMRSGRFREDFYYRLCSDIITTPSLHQRLREEPGELRALVGFLARRIAGDDAAALTKEVIAWIDGNMGVEYAWPGNVRELEQCVRNVLVRGVYHPARAVPIGMRQQLAEAIAGGSLTAEELLGRYCTIVYAQTGNYVQTARKLGLDRRTVKAKVDEALLAECQGAGESAPV